MAAKALPGLEIPRRLVFPPFVEETLLESTLCSSLGMVSDLRSPTVLTVEAISPKARCGLQGSLPKLRQAGTTCKICLESKPQQHWLGWGQTAHIFTDFSPSLRTLTVQPAGSFSAPLKPRLRLFVWPVSPWPAPKHRAGEGRRCG